MKDRRYASVCTIALYLSMVSQCAVNAFAQNRDLISSPPADRTLQAGSDAATQLKKKLTELLVEELTTHWYPHADTKRWRATGPSRPTTGPRSSIRPA